MMSFAYNSPVPIVTPFPFMYSYRDRTSTSAILPSMASSSSATTSPPQQPLQQVQLKQPPQTQQLLSAVEQHTQDRNQQLQQQQQQQQQTQLDAAVRLHQLRNSQPTPPKLPSVEPSPSQSQSQSQSLSQLDKLAPQLPPLTPQLATPTLHQSVSKPQPLHQQHSPSSPLAQPFIQSPPAHEESSSITSAGKPKRKNRPGKKFGAKKRSWVWTWFDQDSSDPNVAGCNYCGKIIIRLASDKGSPKKLNEHLKTHKIDINSINYSRNPHIDGHGITYSNSGQPLDYPPNFRTFRVHDNSNHDDTTSETSGDENHNVKNTTTTTTTITNINRSTSRVDLDNNRRFLSSEFDNSPYSPKKFRAHLLKFLTENKLPISVIKSNSFQQLIYDLRSDSISDLTELTTMYPTLIEVSRFSKEKSNDDNMTNALTEQFVNHVEPTLLQNNNNNIQDSTTINDTSNDNSSNTTVGNNDALDLKLDANVRSPGQ